MNSRIYTGTVMHARFSPVQHRFRFPYYFYAIDLDELPELDRTLRGFGYNRRRPVSLHDSDYLTGSGGFREKLSAYVNTDELDRIILITVARFFRRHFNPVSFYYGLRKDGSPACIVAEVNNTFSERHLYVLPCKGPYPVHCRHRKLFHVSPFNDMQGSYEFSFSDPGDRLEISIRLIRDDKVLMDAHLCGNGEELTASSLWKTVLRYPFSAALTMPRILWQAALLHYRRRLPVFTKPDPSSAMTIIGQP